MNIKEYKQKRKESQKKRILGPPVEHKFVIIMDVMSHYLSAAEIEGDVNKINLRKSFDNLFRQGLPRFMVKNI